MRRLEFFRLIVSFSKKSGCDLIKDTLPVTILTICLAQGSSSSCAIVRGSLASAVLCATLGDASLAQQRFFFLIRPTATKSGFCKTLLFHLNKTGNARKS